MTPATVLVAFLAALSLAANIVFLFRHGWTWPSRARTVCMNASVVFFSLLAVWMPLELAFMYWAVEPDNFTFTLAAERWEDLHWKPRNDLRYRDEDYEAEDLEGRRVLFVAGDSYVAGHGIENCEDRFSNVLGKRLGPQWVVMNVARNGWNTGDEFAAIVSHPHRPDRIVLSYVHTYIVDAATDAGFGRPTLASKPPALLRPFVERSHVLNWLYWRVVRRAQGREMLRKYAEYRNFVFENEDVRRVHRAELQHIVDYGRDEGIALDVVVFPDLTDVAGTRRYTERIADFFRAEGVRVLDLAPLLEGRDPATMVVGPMDAHPGEALHHEVGDLLYERFFSARDPLGSSHAINATPAAPATRQ